MVTHMKTTIELPDELLRQAKAAAREQGTTLRHLVETGLRLVLQRQGKVTTFELREASFGGDGLQPEFADGSWERIRSAIYEDSDG